MTRRQHEEPATARLDVRLSAKDKAEILEAAALLGTSTSAFVLQATRREAARVRHERRLLELSERDQRAFTKALLAPPRPNAALRAAAKAYREAREVATSKHP